MTQQKFSCCSCDWWISYCKTVALHAYRAEEKNASTNHTNNTKSLAEPFENLTLRVQKWNEQGRPLSEALRHQLEDEGYEVFEWSDAPGTVYRPHSHEDDQSHWIISGALELTVGSESYTLQPGDRDFLAANTVHSAYVPGSQPVRYLIGSKRS